MLHRHTYKNIAWIDLKSPTKKEVQSLLDEYGIQPLVGKQLLSPTVRSKADIYDTYAYLILHFPSILRSRGEEIEQEIDFVVGRNFIITAHYEPIRSLSGLAESFDAEASHQGEDVGNHIGFLFFYILRHLYRESAEELETIGDSLPKIEKAIFSGMEHEMVYTISHTSRQLIDFKHAIRLHKEMLDSFDLAGKKLFGEESLYHLRAISGEYYRVASMLQSHIDIVSELRNTNNSLLSTKTNDTMKILTIMAFVTFPPMLFTSLFGMNTKYLPFVGGPYDFWIIIGIMSVATFIFFIFFKYKKWL